MIRIVGENYMTKVLLLLIRFRLLLFRCHRFRHLVNNTLDTLNGPFERNRDDDQMRLLLAVSCTSAVTLRRWRNEL